MRGSGSRTEDPRQRLGDRLERALQERSDVDAQIAHGAGEEPSRGTVVRTLVWLGVTGVSMYLVAPGLIETLGSWRDVQRLSPGWVAGMAGLQALAIICLWWLQGIALHTRQWFAVATSQLASNGISKVVPGGGAVGAAFQYKLLVRAGIDRPRVVAGLTAATLLTLGIVMGLPILAIPTMVRGGADRSLVEAAFAGLVAFALLFAVGAAMLALDGPLHRVALVVQGIRNALRRGADPVTGLPGRLLQERDRILGAVGPRWKLALTAGVGRWAFDYLSLLAALAAVGSTPRPTLVLLAFCASQLLAQVPLTPGGLGFVEAGLTATLTLAGVSPGQAVLATFAYRLFTFWLALPLGLAGGILHRRRFGVGDEPAAAAT